MLHELIERNADGGNVNTPSTWYYNQDHFAWGGGAAVLPPIIQQKQETYRPFVAHGAGVPEGGSYGSKRVLGNSHLLCCCVLTSDGSNIIAAAIILIAVTLIFSISVVPRGEIYSYVIVAFFSIAALTCLTLSVTVDPGILLPIPPDPQRHPDIVQVNGNEVLCKVCPSCHIVRPPRSSHCRNCDYCVEEFDHHCAVLGSCVGKRTFRFFGGFLFFLSALALFVGIRSVVVLSVKSHDASTSTGRWALAAPIISIVAAFGAGLVALPFTFYYVYLACMDLTLKEVQKRGHSSFQPNQNYNQGVFRNLWLRFFSPLGKSRITAENANSYI